MKFSRLLIVVLAMLPVAAMVWAAVPTTIVDFFLPGSQPLESGTIKTPSDCGCHSDFNQSVEPMFNWRGSMMAQAARDPLFFACMAIANQDAPQSGDLCIRCHSPKGWLEGRSVPTNGSALTSQDREGIMCHFCHKMVKPSAVGVNPFPGDAFYTSNTYSADQTYLGSIATIPAHSGNGMYVVDRIDYRRGPYTDANPPHDFYYSPFHKSSDLCGTCHDVSNPAFTRQLGDDYSPNAFNQSAPNFNPHSMFPLERTFSEWKMSSYNTPQGVYAPQFGGNRDTVRSCQDCHMHDVTGKGCQQGGAPTRTDLGLHDLTGGNTFMPRLVKSLYAGEVDTLALNAGIQRATYMLQNAASLSLSSQTVANNHQITVQVTNETAHKLPSGYPEGRRMWLNVRAYNSSNQLIEESGAYDTATGILTHDINAKIYEMKLGISNSLSPTVGLPAGPSFHFVLNDTVFKDNRVPPRGFTNADFDSIQSPPVAYSYVDSQYWDETQYLISGAAAKVVVTLYYQSTSKEYVEFLRNENVTDSTGQLLYNLWSANGKSAPVVMKRDSLLLTPQSGNNAPVLASIGNRSVNEGVNLNFNISATDPDGTIPTFTSSTLPTGATLTNNGNGTATFNWTPTFAQFGVYPVTFRATDGALVDTEVVQITVNNVNQPPVLASIGNRSVNENVNLNFNISATDPDGTIPTFTSSTLPTGATLTNNGNGTATFNWTPGILQSGAYPVTFRASDGALADTEVIQITVNNVPQPPVLAAIGNKSVNENQNLNFIVSASDTDGTTPHFTTSTLPTGATFADNLNGTGTFNWTPSFTQAATYNVVFRAADGSLVDTEIVQITVNNVNRPPTLGTIGNKLVNEGQLLQFLVTATDPDIDSIILTSSTLPAGAVFFDSGNGTALFGWTPNYAQAGSYPMKFYVADVWSAVDSESITITVNEVNNPPVLVVVGNKTVNEGLLLQFNVSASDAEGDSVILSTSTLPAGASFGDHFNDTGTFNWTPSFSQSGSYPITFYAADSSGAVDSEAVTITVNNVNRAPVLSSIGSKSVAEGGMLEFTVSANDPDIDSLILSAAPLPANATFVDNFDGTAQFRFFPDFDQSGGYDIKFRVTDGRLADSEQVHITVSNTNRAPIMSEIGSQTVQADQLLSFVISATDPDNDAISFSVTPLPGTATFTDLENGSAIFEWTPVEADTGVYFVRFIAEDGNLSDTELVTVTVLSSLGCCIGNRGDLNYDGIDANIIDLNFIVNRIFRGGASAFCPEEADVNIDGTPENILDLNFIINRIFRGGPRPGPC